MESSAPLISVLIPLYNQGEFLKEAVESVISQTYSPIEIVIINDGSTDNSDEVAAELVKKYDTVTYIKQENAGVSLACNRALGKATGTYVVRLDADDTMPPDYIAKLHMCLSKQNHRIAFAYADAKFMGAREGLAKSKSFSRAALVQENFINVSGLIRAEILKKTGYYNPNMKWGLEDWDLWLTLTEAGFKGVYCPDTFLNYRIKRMPSRNHLDADKYRKMRRQVYKNHPKLYRNPLNKFFVQYWRVKKRVQAIREA